MLKLPKFKKKIELKKSMKKIFEAKVKQIAFETMKKSKKTLKFNGKFLVYG
jgi:hypothetical protein